jgi:hypothetical protein
MILGDHVSTSIGFFRLVPVETYGSGPNRVFTDELVACNSVVAPEYEWQDEEGMSLHPYVYCLCLMEVVLQPSMKLSLYAQTYRLSLLANSKKLPIRWASNTTKSISN